VILVVGVLKAQEDIAGGRKREEEEVEEEDGEDPYNEENIEQVGYSSCPCIKMHFQSFRSQP